jgi:hypothetical protein
MLNRLQVVIGVVAVSFVGATITGCGQVAESEASHLTEAEVLSLADTFAKARHEQYEPFDPSRYPDRSATYDATSETWSVHYMRIPNRYPGDHFTIRVADSTREMKYVGGA